MVVMPLRLVWKSCLRNRIGFVFRDMKRQIYFCSLLVSLLNCFACGSLDDYDNQDTNWTWVNTGKKELSHERVVHNEIFGTGNTLRYNQSMCIYDDKAFCFNEKDECLILDINTGEWFMSEELPIKSHQNNAQFVNSYFKSEDKYPMLLLSRGDCQNSYNDVYLVRVNEIKSHFSFSVVKTIHNTIDESKYGGCWVMDEENQRLYLYCMTLGDWRITEDNKFCIFSFSLPDIHNSDDVFLGYEDVLERWEYSYLIHQGGTYYNGYLFFNVESMRSYEGQNIATTKDVIAINTRNGHIDAIMPLRDRKETEGICVYKNKLYVSFKNGISEQSPSSIVFSLKEYTLPLTISQEII